MPDDSDSPEDGFDGRPTDDDGKHESFDRTSKKQSIAGRPLGRKSATQPGGIASGDGDGGDRGSEGNGDEGSGTSGGESGRVPVVVKSRAFLRDPGAGTYSLTIHPPKPQPTGDVYLSLAAVGDDAVAAPLRIKAAKIEGGRVLGVPKLGSIGPVRFPRNGPLRVEATLEQPRRLALDVSAYEVIAHEVE